MREFLAVVGDTWRQSKSQIVFKILCGLLLLVALGVVGYPKLVDDSNGEPQFSLLGQDEPLDWPAEWWAESMTMSRMMQRDDRINMASAEKQEEVVEAKRQAREELETELGHLTKLQKSVQLWVHVAAGLIFTLSMLFFIGAASSYFPNMLQTGAVDVVLAKPLSRLQVFLGKYFGGLVMFTGVITVTYLLIAVGLGLRTGVWSAGLFMVIPMQVFAAAVLFAIIAAIGVTFRSSTLSIILGYVFYLVIDTTIDGAVGIRRMGLTAELPLVDRFLGLAEYLPNFGYLKTVACNSCLHVAEFDPKPVVVAAAWGLAILGLGYTRFRKADF